MLRLIVSACIALAMLAACKSEQPVVIAGDAPQLSDAQAQQMVPGSELLPAESNTARTAAMIVSTLPPIADPRQALEVQLHAAMYRAAYQSNVGDFTRHFLLEPADDRTGFVITISQREFRLRVLAALDDLNTPIAWVNPRLGMHSRDGNLFPGTNSLATRLQISINKRLEDQASVNGDVGDWTMHVGSSRQGVTATWDGREWTLQRDPVRLFW